jgi:hypothetical protein
MLQIPQKGVITIFPETRFRDVHTYCFFLGFPRSSTTLMAALLNAHPHIAIALELHVFRQLSQYPTQESLFEALIDKVGQDQTQIMNKGYVVRGWFQADTSSALVIGDKKAGGTSFALSRKSHQLGQLRELLDPSIRFRVLCLVRNPYDTIATIMNKAVQNDLSHNSLAASIARYERILSGIEAGIGMLSEEELLCIHSELITLEPDRTLTQILEFLGVEIPDGYLDACKNVLFAEPRLTRHSVKWTPLQKLRINRLIAKHDLLQGYSFDNSSFPWEGG